MDKMVAIGEIGLDYYWHKEEEEHQIQKKMFRAQLDIAREEKLPFMIHSREAAEDTLNIVREYMQGGMYGGKMCIRDSLSAGALHTGQASGAFSPS